MGLLRATKSLDGTSALAMMTVSPVKCKSSDAKSSNGSFSAMLNASTVDLEGDLFDPNGVDLSVFKALGGPIMFVHEPHHVLGNGMSTVIAKTENNIRATGDGIFIGKADFDSDELSQHYRGKVDRGYIRGMSIGLIITDFEFRMVDGRDVRVITRSILVHGIITPQPVNTDSLIQSVSDKSTEQIEKLGKDLSSFKAASADRMSELVSATKAMTERIEELVSKGQSEAASKLLPEVKSFGDVAAAIASSTK